MAESDIRRHDEPKRQEKRRSRPRKPPDQVKIIAGINRGRKPRRRPKSQSEPP